MIRLDRVLLWRYVQCTKKGHLHRITLNDPTLASLHSNQPGHWINRFRLVTLDWLIRSKRDLFSSLDKQRENIVSSRNESRRRSLIIYDITNLVTYFKSLFVKIFQFHFYFSFSSWRRFVLQTEVSGKFVERYFVLLSAVLFCRFAVRISLPSLYLALMLLI